jgi:hypothetical protein
VDFASLVAGALATWRVSHLLHAEDGPWQLVVQLRAAAGSSFVGEAMDCFYCLSLWLALPIAFAIGSSVRDCLLLWPALSAAAILLERWKNPEPPPGTME